MIIAIGADHRGFAHKEQLKKMTKIGDQAITWHDVGCFTDERCDYPSFAVAVVQAMQQHKADCAILLCGTGIGMAIAANRFAGIYAGVAWNEEVAALSKSDDNTNVLVLPSDFISHHEAQALVISWLRAQFKSGHYQDRLELLETLTTEQLP